LPWLSLAGFSAEAMLIEKHEKFYHRRSVCSAFFLEAERSLKRDLMLKNPPIVTTIERQAKIPRLRKKKNVQILIQSI